LKKVQKETCPVNSRNRRISWSNARDESEATKFFSRRGRPEVPRESGAPRINSKPIQGSWNGADRGAGNRQPLTAGVRAYEAAKKGKRSDPSRNLQGELGNTNLSPLRKKGEDTDPQSFTRVTINAKAY